MLFWWDRSIFVSGVSFKHCHAPIVAEDESDTEDGLEGSADESGSEAEDDEGASEPSARRQRLDEAGRRADARRARRQAAAQREASLEAYYSQGVSYGKPAACLMFDLATYLGHETSHMLWYGVNGAKNRGHG